MRKTNPVLFLLSALLVTSTAGCTSSGSEQGRTTPPELRGVWVCDNPDYAGRKMEILEEALIFHLGEGAYDPYVIRSIRVEPGIDGTSYHIEHSGWESGSLLLSFFFRSADSTIVFENQPLIVWRRQPAEG